MITLQLKVACLKISLGDTCVLTVLALRRSVESTGKSVDTYCQFNIKVAL